MADEAERLEIPDGDPLKLGKLAANSEVSKPSIRSTYSLKNSVRTLAFDPDAVNPRSCNRDHDGRLAHDAPAIKSLGEAVLDGARPTS